MGEYRIRVLLPLLPAERSRCPKDQVLILDSSVQIWKGKMRRRRTAHGTHCILVWCTVGYTCGGFA